MVTDLIDKEYDGKEQETSETKTEACALKTDVFVFASRSKAKAKPRRLSNTCSSTRTELNFEKVWTDIELGSRSNQAYPVAKRQNIFSMDNYPEKKMGRFEFWRLKDDFRNKENSQYWSDDVWKSKMEGGRGNKKRFRYCIDPSRQEILYIDPILQDNVLIPKIFFEYISHIGCAVSLHSITNSGLIPGGLCKSERTDGILYGSEAHE